MAAPTFINDRFEEINVDRMRKYRVNRATEQLKKDGLGCLITWDAASIRYLTSIYVTIPMRWAEAAFAVIFNDGEYYAVEPHPGMWREGMSDTPWLSGRAIPRFGMLMGKHARTAADWEPLVKVIAKMMADHGVTKEPIGIDGCTGELPLQEAFQNVGIKAVDGKSTMLEARQIHNQDEIECTRIACTIAEAAFADIQAAVRPGIKECELVGIGMKRMYELGADECQEYVFASGERTNPQHADFTDRMIRAGDIFYIDTNGCSFMGYKVCYYRTFCCGKPTAEQEEVYELQRAVAEDMIAAFRPGITTEEYTAKMPHGAQVYHGHKPTYWGFDSWEAQGAWSWHGIGQALHELPLGGPGRPFKLEEGMVLASQQRAAIKGKGEGARLEDDIAITKDGCDVLSKWPRDKITECWI